MYMNRPLQLSAGKAARIEVIWLKMDTGSMISDAACYQAGDHCLFCLLPGQHRQLNINAGTVGSYSSFSMDFLDAPAFKAGFNATPGLYCFQPGLIILSTGTEMRKEIDSILVSIHKEFNNPCSFHVPVITSFLQILMLHLSREIKPAPMPRYHYRGGETTRRFMQLLSEKFADMRMVADYARELCVTPNYLNYTVKKASGFTASYHIQQFLLQEAKKQANCSGATMKEIAYSLGFVDPAHFSRFFKKKSGLNFSSFKKEITHY
jgi:AraC family transcriptional activator of pobA